MILTDTGFSKRDYDRFFVEKLSKVYDVLVLDLAPYLNKKIFNLTLKDQKIFQYKNYVKVKNFKEFEDFLVKNKKVLAMLSTLFQQETKIHSILKSF